MHYEFADWSIDVPDGWDPESDEDCTTFSHPQGVGAFQVSTYRKDEAVTDHDLREFIREHAGEISLADVFVDRFAGFCARFSEGDTFWMMWWLRARHQMIYVTYNCRLSDRGREDDVIATMIQSLIATG